MAKQITQDNLVKKMLKKGPMTALYFSVAINVLRQVIDQKSDDFICSLFGNGIPAARIRHCVHDMDRTLNPEPDAPQTLGS